MCEFMVLPTLYVSADKYLYRVAAFRVYLFMRTFLNMLDKLNSFTQLHEKQKNAALLNHTWIMFLHSQTANIKSFFFIIYFPYAFQRKCTKFCRT